MESYWERVIESIKNKLEQETITERQYLIGVNQCRRNLERVRHSKELIEGQILLRELGI